MEKNRETITIHCDGKELPLGAFVADLYRDTISAMVKNLKGTDTASTITITLSRPAR